MAKQRILYLDILRVLACGMVVLMHSPHPSAGVPGYVQVPLYFITAAGLVLFFMISGALLIPAKISVSAFLKRRIGKIAGPWFFWTIFYMSLEMPKEGFSIAAVERLFVYVSSPGGHIMWFMFVLLGLYLITPILSKYVINASRNEVVFYLVIWCFTLGLPWASRCTTLKLGISSPLYYFSGYVGYFLLGYFLNTYRPKLPYCIILLLFFIPLMARILYAFLGGNHSSELFSYLSVPVMFMSVAWFSLILRKCDPISISTQMRKWLTALSDSTFGIYLVHLFVMRNLLWRIDFVVNGCGWFGQVVITWLLTLAISYTIIYGISFLPFSEYIIGYHHKS